MTNQQVIEIVLTIVKDFMTEFWPVIAVLAALNFVLTFMMSVLWGIGKRASRD